MPRRGRKTALRPWRLVLVATAAASGTAGSWPPVTGSRNSNSNSKHASSDPFLSKAEATAASASSRQHTRSGRGWGAFPQSLNSGRRRGPGRHPQPGHRLSGDGGAEFVPLWVRARGGAVGKRAQVGRSLVEGEDGLESGAEEEEQDGDGAEGDEEEEGVDTAASEDELPADSEEEGGGGGSNSAAAGTEAAGKAGKPSVAESLDLKTVLPQALKTGVCYMLARWVSKNLSPAVESQVRMARVIYTAYLIFSQALCMYIRYRIWKRDDNTEIQVPPPAQLKSLLQDSKLPGAMGAAAAASGGAAEAETAGGTSDTASPSPLGPMLDKMMTSKILVKKYDMKTIQGVRRGQFWASLIMCFTHLRRGMIKPMILQVSFGLLSQLDHPLFHIHVLGREAKGNLARPFKKQGLAASLTGPSEAIKAAVERQQTEMQTRLAEAEAAAAGKTPEENDEAADSSGGQDDDDGEMPDIEVLTDGDGDGHSSSD